LIEDLHEVWIQKIINIYDKKLLFVFRRPNLETIHMPIDQRKKIIDSILQSNALLDLDISQKEELNYIQQKENKNIILSYHNYQETPDEQTLQNIVQIMETYQPKIYKIATTCLSEKDGLVLMNLLEKLKQEKKQYIIVGMGNAGKIIRVYGMLYGNTINFAPGNLEEQSAKGQITIEKMKKIYTILTSS